jgi:solute carrier family 25 protein 33/36
VPSLHPTRLTPLILSLGLNSLGGMCGSIVTAPFDVVKTRLQSDLFQAKVVDGGKVVTRTGIKGLLWNFVDTGKILRCVVSFSSALLSIEEAETLLSLLQGRLQV